MARLSLSDTKDRDFHKTTLLHQGQSLASLAQEVLPIHFRV